MTKLTENDTPAGRDRPVVSKFGEGYDSVVSDYRQTLERLNNALVFEGLSLSEAYIEGRARIAVEFGAHPSFEADGSRLISVWHHERQLGDAATSGSASGIEKIYPINRHNSISRDQDMMLIGDVELVDAIKFIPCHLERLYFIENELDYAGARDGSCFLSIKGGFRILPRVTERELSPSVHCAIVGLNEGTVSVVQGRPEIVYGVADDGRRMPGDTTPEGSPFPSVRIGLRAEGFNVVHHVGPDNRFKLMDVMIGPFYF